MASLGRLSEEVSDYLADQIISAKTKNLKSTMCAEFSNILHLRSKTMNAANFKSLTNVTRETLLRFLDRIALIIILKTPIIDTLPIGC